MARFMVVTLLLVGWGFFEMSGGTDFVPPQAEAKPLNDLMEEAARQDATQVARADTAPARAKILAPETSEAGAPVTLASFTQAGTSLATVLGEAAKIATPEPEVTEIIQQTDLRVVTGNRVNMRNGPGTNYQVLTQLLRGAEAEVLQAPGNGWVKIRVASSGRVGWMAERLMRKVN